MKTKIVSYVPFGRLSDVENPELCLIKSGKGIFDNVEVIRFPSRLSLESFNKKAGLRPLVYTEDPKGCAVWAHQKEATL